MQSTHQELRNAPMFGTVHYFFEFKILFTILFLIFFFVSRYLRSPSKMSSTTSSVALTSLYLQWGRRLQIELPSVKPRVCWRWVQPLSGGSASPTGQRNNGDTSASKTPRRPSTSTFRMPAERCLVSRTLCFWSVLMGQNKLSRSISLRWRSLMLSPSLSRLTQKQRCHSGTSINSARVTANVSTLKTVRSAAAPTARTTVWCRTPTAIFYRSTKQTIQNWWRMLQRWVCAARVVSRSTTTTVWSVYAATVVCTKWGKRSSL